MKHYHSIYSLNFPNVGTGGIPMGIRKASNKECEAWGLGDGPERFFVIITRI